jgi:hypothetical protein
LASLQPTTMSAGPSWSTSPIAAEEKISAPTCTGQPAGVEPSPCHA